MRKRSGYLLRRVGFALAISLVAAGQAQASWREWLGREPKPEEQPGLLDSLDPLHLLLILVLFVLIIWALRRPDNIRRGIAEGFGNALGSFVGLILGSLVIACIGGGAGMVATGSYTFVAFAIWFVLTLMACVIFYFLVILNS